MNPRTRGIDLFVFLSLLLAPVAFAAHSASITSNYASIYETNSANVTLTVDNDLFSTASINTVAIAPQGFSIGNILQILGWNTLNNNSITFSTSTNAISNWGLQRFGMEIAAGNVNTDTQYTWNIDTTDTNNDVATDTLQFTILNDDTPPVLGTTTPDAFTLGTDNELFSVQASDAETGIANANLHLSNCDAVIDPLSNISSVPYTTTAVVCSAGTCSSSQDLSSWPEGDACFFFDVSNRGGETATTDNLTTIIDRTPPTVTLATPADNDFIDASSVDLQFNATDNFDTSLDCTVNVDGNSNAVTANGASTFTTTASEGSHTWSVACTDEVGLTGTSATQTFTIDTQGPVIGITAPTVVDRGTAATITTSISDIGIGIDENSISAIITEPNGTVTPVSITNNEISYSTTTATEPGNYVLTISADDLLGHSTTETATFRVRETYAITLSLSQSQIDASSVNNTLFVSGTGTVTRDDGFIPSGTVDITAIVGNDTVSIDNATGAYTSQIEIPQSNGGYTIYASFTNGVDVFTAQAGISVGPYCGNNIIDAGEQCDGSTAAVCSEYGFSQGTTSCSAQCTIDSSQCSNPPQQSGSSGGGSGRSSRSSSSGFFVAPPAIPVLVDTSKTAGIIEQPEESQGVETAGLIETQNATIEHPESTFALSAAWAAMTDYIKNINKSILGMLLVIGALLYIVGWRKKDDDDWDRYFKRYGHH